MTDALRLGVIGVGDVAQRDYLPEIGRLEPEAVVVAVAGAGEQRVREVAERLGVDAHVGYASLLGDDDVDAVLNLTPAQLHEEVNAAAIGAGKHIYSEKPLAMTADAARALGERAAERAHAHVLNGKADRRMHWIRLPDPRRNCLNCFCDAHLVGFLPDGYT